METVGAWLGVPLAALLLTCGIGFAVRALLWPRLDAAVVPAVGLAGLIAIGSPMYALGASAWVVFGTCTTCALVGWILAVRRSRSGDSDWREMFSGWALLTGAIVFTLYAAPFAATGTPTFGGYGFLGDTSFHLSLAAWMTDHGATTAGLGQGSFGNSVRAYLSSGYPLGVHGTLATVARPIPLPLYAIYQPLLAYFAAAGAASAAALLRRSGVSVGLAIPGAVAALCAFLPFAYGAEGSIKEIAAIGLGVSAAAVAMNRVHGPENMPSDAASGPRDRVGGTIVLGIVIGALLGTYSIGILPWVSAFLVAVLFLELFGKSTRPIRSVVLGTILAAAVAALTAIPTLVDAAGFKAASTPVASSPAELGNLFQKLPFDEVWGNWIASDFRTADSVHPRRSFVGSLLVIALGFIGTIWLLFRRSGGPLLYAVPALAVYIYFAPRASPWLDAKLLTLLSPGLVLLAAAGAGALGRRITALGIAAAVALLGGVLVADAYTFRGVYLAPTNRFSELETLARGNRISGRTLLNEDEPFSAVLMKGSDLVNPYDGYSVTHYRYTPPTPDTQWLDLDALNPEYVAGFDTIVVRKSPAASRPPVLFSKTYSGRFYEVWRRTGPLTPPLTFGRHYDSGTSYQSAAFLPCKRALDLAATARQMSGKIVGLAGPRNLVAIPSSSHLPKNWVAIPLAPDRTSFFTPAISFAGAPNTTMSFDVRIRRTAEYRAWLGGTFGPGYDVAIDGRPLGRAHDVQSGGQFAELKTVSLTKGTHEVTIKSIAGGFKPASRYPQFMTALVLQPVQSRRFFTVNPDAPQELCKTPIDWAAAVPRDFVPPVP